MWRNVGKKFPANFSFTTASHHNQIQIKPVTKESSAFSLQAFASTFKATRLRDYKIFKLTVKLFQFSLASNLRDPTLN